MKKDYKKDYKILVLSDNEVLKKYSVAQLKKRFNDIDFIISAGDVSNRYLDYIYSALDKDLIYINGNHVYSKDHEIPFCKCVDGKIIKYKNIRILGLDGSLFYSGGEHQYTENEMRWRIIKLMSKLIIKKPDIIITHAPMEGIHDKPNDPVHRGFKSFWLILNNSHPKLWIHGHTHLSSYFEKQETIIDDTKIINAYGFKCIELKL